MIGLFRRGRHHVRTVKRGPDGAPLVTVASITKQLRREAEQDRHDAQMARLRVLFAMHRKAGAIR